MIPERITICGIPHTVKLCEDRFDTDLHMGMIQYAQAEIRINKNATEEMQMMTLFHEILHAIFVLSGRSDEGQDEQLVQLTANAMFQIFELRPDACYVRCTGSEGGRAGLVPTGEGRGT